MSFDNFCGYINSLQTFHEFVDCLLFSRGSGQYVASDGGCIVGEMVGWVKLIMEIEGDFSAFLPFVMLSLHVGGMSLTECSSLESSSFIVFIKEELL